MSHIDPLTVVVKGILSQQGMSGRELARRTGITPATMNRRFRLGGWKTRELERVAAALGVKASDLQAQAEAVAA